MFDSPIAHWRASDSTPQLLHDHLRNVGALAKAFASKLKLESAGELIGLLHDLGKYSKEFQDYIGSALGLKNSDEDDYVDADAIRGKVDHSSAGAQCVWNAMGVTGPLEMRLAQMLAICIASHHSGLIDCLDSAGEDTFSRRMHKALDKTHLDEVTRVAEKGIVRRASELFSQPGLIAEFRALLLRILQGCAQTVVQHQQIGLMVRFLFSCLVDADRIDTADFEYKRVKAYRPNGDYVAWPVLVDRLDLRSTERYLQVDLLEADPHLGGGRGARDEAYSDADQGHEAVEFWWRQYLGNLHISRGCRISSTRPFRVEQCTARAWD